MINLNIETKEWLIYGALGGVFTLIVWSVYAQGISSGYAEAELKIVHPFSGAGHGEELGLDLEEIARRRVVPMRPGLVRVMWRHPEEQAVAVRPDLSRLTGVGHAVAEEEP